MPVRVSTELNNYPINTCQLSPHVAVKEQWSPFVLSHDNTHVDALFMIMVLPLFDVMMPERQRHYRYFFVLHQT